MSELIEPSVIFPGLSEILALKEIVFESSNPVIDSTSEAVINKNLSDPRSDSLIKKVLPIFSHWLLPTLPIICILPFVIVVSSPAIGTAIFILVFVEFQKPSISFPPIANTVPVLKSAGGVLSNTTQLASVVLATSIPSFPAESEKLMANTTEPSMSVSKKS